MPRIMISVTEEEKAALIRLGELERRDPRHQAALVVRQELERRGLLIGAPEFQPAVPTAQTTEDVPIDKQ